MAAKFREIWVINVKAPSGKAMKQKRERFFNSELPYLLTGETGHILLGGDFNCILEASDSIGSFTYNRALAELVHSLALTDTWQGNPSRKVYTHNSAFGATRIDGIYATRELLGRKLGVEVIVVPFTDHLAVCLRISIDLQIMRRERGL
jgi:endonuclease/exonuclease/phosphatase family metal-dependent hydrolase